MDQKDNDSALTRRGFLRQSVTTAAGTALLMASGNYAHAQGASTIKVGLIGCGGRGTDAAVNVMEAAQGVEIVALGDVFEDRVKGCRAELTKRKPDQVKLTDDRCFTGFDAYQKVLASDANYVILATPPGFRPTHFKAAVDAGKHIFTEKPVAVDPAGIRTVLAASEVATQKGLGIVAGTQRRHEKRYMETMKRIHDGAIGDIVSGQCYWNQGGLWMNVRKPEWSDMEWQLRNWLYFVWLSGDHICEQHVHNLDVMNWALKTHPVKCVGMGGRQVRTDPAYGHIFDHFAVEYEYPNGVRIQSMCRQIDGTASRVSENLVGTKGTSNASNIISGEKRFRFDGDNPNPYVLEHTDLIASIRAGKPLNEGKQVAESTLTAIMGRLSAYTGQEITWEQALNLPMSTMPEKLDFGSLPVPAVAIPGRTKLEDMFAPVGRVAQG